MCGWIFVFDFRAKCLKYQQAPWASPWCCTVSAPWWPSASSWFVITPASLARRNWEGRQQESGSPPSSSSLSGSSTPSCRYCKPMISKSLVLNRLFPHFWIIFALDLLNRLYPRLRHPVNAASLWYHGQFLKLSSWNVSFLTFVTLWVDYVSLYILWACDISTVHVKKLSPWNVLSLIFHRSLVRLRHPVHTHHRQFLKLSSGIATLKIKHLSSFVPKHLCQIFFCRSLVCLCHPVHSHHCQLLKLSSWSFSTKSSSLFSGSSLSSCPCCKAMTFSSSVSKKAFILKHERKTHYKLLSAMTKTIACKAYQTIRTACLELLWYQTLNRIMWIVAVRF